MNKFFKSTRVTMKKILLSSAAIVAFAGAASAEFAFSGTAALGYNDEFSDGVYVDADMDISASTELNNGWTASLTYGVELSQKDEGESNDAQAGVDDNLTLALTNGTYTLTYGDTEHAAVSKWSGVSEMNADVFSEQDGEDVLKAEADFGDYAFAVSGIVDADGNAITDDTGDIKQASFGAVATYGQYNFGASYQEEDFTVLDASGDYVPAEVLGLFVSTTFAGADVTVAYAEANAGPLEMSSFGVEVAYPVGDITLGAFYVAEDANFVLPADETYGVSALYAAGAIEAKVYYQNVLGLDEYGVGASYDMNNGLVVTAGYIGGDDLTDDDYSTYITAEYDLGGGASLLGAYVDQENFTGGDDIDTVVSDYELRDGFTVELGFTF
jgi:hypothetical protein